jgi:hypothetical protein
VENFKALLNRIAGRFASRQDFAKALKITPSRMSKVLNSGDLPLNVTNCLRVAKLSGESPSEILRAAGKADVAELIESLYGEDRTQLLSAAERELLDEWSRLTPRGRESLRALIAELQPRKSKPSKRSA